MFRDDLLNLNSLLIVTIVEIYCRLIVDACVANPKWHTSYALMALRIYDVPVCKAEVHVHRVAFRRVLNKNISLSQHYCSYTVKSKNHVIHFANIA